MRAQAPRADDSSPWRIEKLLARHRSGLVDYSESVSYIIHTPLGGLAIERERGWWKVLPLRLVIDTPERPLRTKREWCEATDLHQARTRTRAELCQIIRDSYSRYQAKLNGGEGESR